MSLAPPADTQGAPHSVTLRDERRRLLVVLAVAFVLRLAIGAPLDSSGFDTDVMQSWTRTLLAHPLDAFYAEADAPDHLPGDLWFLWLIGHGLELAGFENAPRAPFVVLMKLVPALADTAIALELYVLVRRFGRPAAALAVASAYAFNPASIFLTAVWGQWDAVSMALLLGGLLVILRSVPAALPRSADLSFRSGPPVIPSVAEESPEERRGVTRSEPGSAPQPAGRVEGSLDRLGMTEVDASIACHSERSEESLREALSGEADAAGRSVQLPRGSAEQGGMQHPGGSGPLSGDPPAADVLRTEIHRCALNDGGGGRDAGSRWALRDVLPLWPLAVPLLTWAVLIKPPLALLAALFVLYGLAVTWEAASTTRAAVVRVPLAALAAGVLAVATSALLLLPFDVGLPGMPARWSLLERARFALDLYPATTLQAPNVWMLKDAHLYRPSDVDGSWLGLTERTWGTVLLALGLAWIAGVVVAWWRAAWWGRSRGSAPQVQMLVWAALALTFAAFMLPTRVHERYYFPVLVLALALAGLRAGRDGDRTALWLALGVSVTFLLTLLVGYGATSGGVRSLVGGVSMAAAFRTLAAANVGLFLVTMALPLRRGWMSGHEGG